MAKMTPMRSEPRFSFKTNHRKLEPMLVDADRKQRKGARKKQLPGRPTLDRVRQDD